MSTVTSIEDLFKKKDRKKKRAAARLAQQEAVSSQEAGGNTVTTNPASNTVESTSKTKTEIAPPSQPAKSDDGWIEIEDVRGSQVNTGGRTVVEFRRNMEEKTNVDETATPTEKFSGWGKPNPTADTGNTEESDEAASQAPTQSPEVAGVSSEAAFPSLADAAKIQVTTPQTISGTTPGVGSTSRGPPRFIVDKEKLREKIEKRNAADGIFPAKTQLPDQANESPPSSVPSLADASKLQGTSTATPAPWRPSSGGGASRGRPQFVLDKEKLRAKIEKRNAAPPS